MKPKFTNLYDLQQHFRSDEVCRRYLEIRRWKGKPICPFCGSEKVYKCSGKQNHKCANKDCHKKFSATVGTIFENTKIPLRKWFIGIYLMTAHKKGISSLQLSRDLGITQRSAWFMNHRIREMLREKGLAQLSGIVEADETYVGGKLGNKHEWKRKQIRKLGTGAIDKTPVFAMVERGGKIFTRVIKKADGKTLKPIIHSVIGSQTLLITDGLGAYSGLGKFFHHEIVNHEIGEFSRDIFHTNTVEGFFGLLKRGIIGIYHQVSPKHLHRYCDEFSARYNTRKVSESVRFDLFMTTCAGRLKYNDLIGNK